jgi:hypothetical protein
VEQNICQETERLQSTNLALAEWGALEALLSTSSAELQHHSPALSGTEVAYFSKPPEATSQLPIFLLLHQFSMKKYCLCNLK